MFLTKLIALFATIFRSKFNDFKNFHEYGKAVVNAQNKCITLGYPQPELFISLIIPWFRDIIYLIKK